MKKGVDKPNPLCYNSKRPGKKAGSVAAIAAEGKGEISGTSGSIAQLGEHLPYKQRVIGSSPIVSTMLNYSKENRVMSFSYGILAR